MEANVEEGISSIQSGIANIVEHGMSFLKKCDPKMLLFLVR